MDCTEQMLACDAQQKQVTTATTGTLLVYCGGGRLAAMKSTMGLDYRRSASAYPSHGTTAQTDSANVLSMFLLFCGHLSVEGQNIILSIIYMNDQWGLWVSG